MGFWRWWWRLCWRMFLGFIIFKKFEIIWFGTFNVCNIWETLVLQIEEVYKWKLKKFVWFYQLREWKSLFITFFLLEFEFLKPLRFVKIKFSAPVFDKVTKDRAAKFVDQLSAIGGTMGLLTGFSIISGVEIIYFAFKIALVSFNNFRKKMFKNKTVHQL